MSIDLNKLHNCKNPYQGTVKKVLCICSAGLLRSPTAAIVLQREFGYNTRSAGISPQYALIDVSEVLLHWADEIVVMESWMADELHEFKDKVVCLDIADCFAYMDETLQQTIKDKYNARNSKSS